MLAWWPEALAEVQRKAPARPALQMAEVPAARMLVAVAEQRDSRSQRAAQPSGRMAGQLAGQMTAREQRLAFVPLLRLVVLGQLRECRLVFPPARIRRESVARESMPSSKSWMKAAFEARQPEQQPDHSWKIERPNSRLVCG